VNRVASIFIAASVIILAGAIALAMWQARTAAPAPPAIATNAPVVGQSEANFADVKPVALADISGNIAGGQPAPDFTVRTMGGGQFALAEHRDQPTMILFMASWCVSCIYEAQNLAEVHARYKERGLNIIALDVQDGDTDADLQAFRESAGNPDYVWAFDDSYAVTQAYNVRTLDTTVLIDQAGNVVYYDQRPTPLEPLLQAAMAVLP
jgi:thiol-disulfide isomerase/thioredoxin